MNICFFFVKNKLNSIQKKKEHFTKMREYSTKDIENILLAEHIMIRNDRKAVEMTDSLILRSEDIQKNTELRRALSDGLFNYFVKVYADNAKLEFKSYDDTNELFDKSYLWKITYDGKLDNLEDLELDKCYMIQVYNMKFGLKNVAGGVNPKMSKREKMSAFRKMIVDDFTTAWMECSGAVEHLALKYGGRKYRIDPRRLEKYVYTGKNRKNFQILEDGVHFSRELSDGTKIVKIALGQIDVPHIDKDWLPKKLKEESEEKQRLNREKQLALRDQQRMNLNMQ